MLQALRHFEGVTHAVQVSRLAAWVNMGLVVLLAYTLAQLTWVFFSDSPSAPAPRSVSMSREGPTDRAPGVERALEGLHLFGTSAERPAPEQTAINAPETRLNLTLKGVFSEDDQEMAVAIIASGRDEKHYRVGDALGAAARVYRIYADRVILKRDSRYETLALPRDELIISEPDGQRNIAGAQESQPNGGTASGRILSGVRAQLRNSPTEALKLIRAQPVMESGKLKGYRINPGVDRELFGSAGFRPGDVVVSVNGLDVSTPENLQRIYRHLRRSGRVSVNVERGGQPLVLELNLD